jgi:hypothetical protein
LRLCRESVSCIVSSVRSRHARRRSVIASDRNRPCRVWRHYTCG